jgi:hypothetical protein
VLLTDVRAYSTFRSWADILCMSIQCTPRSVERYTRKSCGHGRNTVDGSNALVRDELFKRAALDVGSSLVKYKHGRQLIVTSSEDQLLLQQTGMMSGRQMILFNRLLVEMTRISIYSTSTTLAGLQYKQMPDYTICMVNPLVNKTMQPR